MSNHHTFQISWASERSRVCFQLETQISSGLRQEGHTAQKLCQIKHGAKPAVATPCDKGAVESSSYAHVTCTVTVRTRVRRVLGKKLHLFLSLAYSPQFVANPSCSIQPCWNGIFDWCASTSYFSLLQTNNTQFHCISELLDTPNI